MAKHRGVKDSGEYFVITPASKKVTVPHAHKSIGTVGDHNSEQITFECPQMVDGHDVSQCARRYVSWVNVEGKIGHDELQVAEVEQGTEGMIYLSWTIRNALTVAKGIVQFSIHFEDVDENGITLYRWSTATCKDCEILDSINGILATYEAVYVSGDALVFADYTPVTDGTVEINTTMIPEGTLKITNNGTFPVGEYASVEVAVNLEEPTITIDDTGLVEATVKGFSSCAQLSAEHDSDFKPENIKKGVNIFGVNGTFTDINARILTCRVKFTASLVYPSCYIDIEYCGAGDNGVSNLKTRVSIEDFAEIKVLENSIMRITCNQSRKWIVEPTGTGVSLETLDDSEAFVRVRSWDSMSYEVGFNVIVVGNA